MQNSTSRHPWTPCQTRAKRALTAAGYTCPRIAALLKERGVSATPWNVRNVVTGATKRADIRAIIAELTGKPVQALWPDETRDNLVA